MSDAIDKHLASAKELILGFDAGCSSCSGIATRIEERVGDKLVIRNLRDLELMEWRREALGEAAPWAPTLFEVEGGKVRAWVGMKMGLALSRRLGPKDTWRVMQLLGEMGAGPDIADAAVIEALPIRTQEAVAGMSRGQFLKGISGAAVAASVLSGGMLLPTVAQATTSPGTAAQRTRATSAVRNSQQYAGLASQQSQIGAVFEWPDVNIGVRNSTARVAIYSSSARRSIIANFTVDLVSKHVAVLDTQALRTFSTKRETLVMNWVNDKANNPYDKLTIGLNYVVTPDNRIISREQFAAEVSARNAARSSQPARTSTSQLTFSRAASEDCDVIARRDELTRNASFLKEVGCYVVNYPTRKLSERLEIISKPPTMGEVVCDLLHDDALRSAAQFWAFQECRDGLGNVSQAPPIYKC